MGAQIIAFYGFDDGSSSTNLLLDSAAGGSAPSTGERGAQNGAFAGTGTAPVQVTGLVGAGALSLPGNVATNQYVKLEGAPTTNTPPVLGSNNFTVATFFKRSSTAGVGASTGTGGIASLEPMVAKGNAQAEGSNVDANYILGISTITAGSPKLAADFEDFNNGLNHPITGNTTITNDVWHHAAVTFDGTTFSIYLDGLLETSINPINANSGANPLATSIPRGDSVQFAALGAMLTSTAVASSQTGRNGAFNGSLDEVRIYSGALSLGEIQTLAAAGGIGPAAAPEPASLSLLAIGAGLLITRRRHPAR